MLRHGDCAHDLYDWLLDIKDGNDRIKPSRILRVMERVSLRYMKSREYEYNKTKERRMFEL